MAGKIPRRLDTLAFPIRGAQERRGWHSHAERGNEGMGGAQERLPSFPRSAWERGEAA